MSSGGATAEEVAFHLFGSVRRLCVDLQSSSTRFDAAVKALLAHLQQCVRKLYVEETNRQNPGAEALLTARENWRVDRIDLMAFVTRTLNTAYTEYERGMSGGLTFEMYETFGELVQSCRVCVKQKEIVVLATQEEYERRKLVIAPAIRQDGVAQSAPGHDEFKALKKQVSDLQFAMRAFEPAIRGFHDNKLTYDRDSEYFNRTMISLIGRMEKVEALVPVVERMETVEALVPVVATLVEAAKNKDDHDKIEGLLGRVAELEKPFYRRKWGAKASVQAEVDMSTLLRRMEAFNYVEEEPATEFECLEEDDIKGRNPALKKLLERIQGSSV